MLQSERYMAQLCLGTGLQIWKTPEMRDQHDLLLWNFRLPLKDP